MARNEKGKRSTGSGAEQGEQRAPYRAEQGAARQCHDQAGQEQHRGHRVAQDEQQRRQAAGLFYPLSGWLLSPVFASVAMALSSVTVVSNANRLRLFKPVE